MSVINLSKGQKIDLTKTNPGLTKIMVGLGWDTNRYSGGHDFDLDASAFLVDQNGKALSDKSFIFYNNLQSEDGSVVHTGDNRTGDGDGDDEQLLVNLQQVPSGVHRVVFTVTIHDADSRNQNFGQVSNAFIRIVNDETHEEIVRYDLGEDFSIETALVVGEIYRHGNEWKFNAIGSGFQGGLASLITEFGLS